MTTAATVTRCRSGVYDVQVGSSLFSVERDEFGQWALCLQDADEVGRMEYYNHFMTKRRAVAAAVAAAAELAQ